ncbi:MAG: hypothetical protein ABIH23_22930, partial [bacterium]
MTTTVTRALLTLVLAFGPGRFAMSAATQNIVLPEPDMASVIRNATMGVAFGAMDHFVDFYDGTVSREKNAALPDQARLEAKFPRSLPVHITKVDFPWNRLEPDDDRFSEASVNYTVDINIDGMNASLLAVLAYPPWWIKPFKYDAMEKDYSQYLEEPVVSLDGVTRTGEERMREWEEYVEHTVRRYADKVSIWQIFNEPLHSFTFSKQGFIDDGIAAATAELLVELVPTKYTQMLMDMIQRAALIIRRHDPEAMITVGGFFDVTSDTEILPSQELVRNLLTVTMPSGENLQLDDYVDALSFHVYPGPFPTDTDEANLLSRFANIVAMKNLIADSGQTFEYIIDEYGNPTETEDEVQRLPSVLPRELCLNLVQGVKVMIAFELYDYLFPRDLITDATPAPSHDLFLLRSKYPDDPEVTPGYQTLQALYDRLAGVVPETVVNENAPRSTGDYTPPCTYRSFLNGLDRVLVMWSNLAVPQKVNIEFAECQSVEVLRIHDSTETPLLTEQEISEPLTSLTLGDSENLSSLLPFETVVLTLHYEESGLTIKPNIRDIVGYTEDGLTVYAGHPVHFMATLGINSATLPATWYVTSPELDDANESVGSGVVDLKGRFTGVTPGRCVLNAKVGRTTATVDLHVVKLQKNLLYNSGMDDSD